MLVLSVSLPQGAAGTKTYGSFRGILGTLRLTCTSLLSDPSSNLHCLANLSKKQLCKIN